MIAKPPAAFTSKEALYLEAADHYVMTVGARIWSCLANGQRPGRVFETFF